MPALSKEEQAAAVRERRIAIKGICADFGKAKRAAKAAASQQTNDSAVDVAGSDDNDDSPAAGPVTTTPAEIQRLFGLSAVAASAMMSTSPLDEIRALAAETETAAVTTTAVGKAPSLVKLWSASSSAATEMSRRAKYGRWLPEDRYSLDQVPCMLVEGDTRTYHFKGANQHVWVAGSGKGDEGKRFCTLQLIVRSRNGDKSKLYAEQPWPEICFRGQGKQIKKKEKDAYAPGVHVRFQKKAWYGDVTCLEHAKERLPGITAAARAAHRESCLMVDNLHGQTTPEYVAACKTFAKMTLHLLPAGVTDLIQLIDAGFGYLVKYFMGEYHTEWMAEDSDKQREDGSFISNAENWVAGLEMWEKRVHMTHMLKRGYQSACMAYDFEMVAAKVGMLMTIDGSGDEMIKIKGLPDYSFDDADGGSDDGGSDRDVESDESDAGSELGECGEDEESIGAESDTDEDEFDDTAEIDAAAALAVESAAAPLGYCIDDTPPPGHPAGTAADEDDDDNHPNRLIGSKVLVKWDGAPVPADKFGWYVGTVKRTASTVDQGKGFNFVVKFSNAETGMVLPKCESNAWANAKGASGDYPLALVPETWGGTKRWVVLVSNDESGAGGGPASAKPGAKKKQRARM